LLFSPPTFSVKFNCSALWRCHALSVTTVPKTLFTGLAACVFLATVKVAVAQVGTADQEERAPMPENTIEAVLKAHTPRLMSLPGVVGVGEGRCDGAPCIKVLVLERTPELVERIDVVIEGYKVEVVATGEIRALDSD
jgi:hypothetical protein